MHCFLKRGIDSKALRFLFLLIIFGASGLLNAQTLTVTGTVKDSTGSLMGGVTVSNVSTNTAITVTEQNGLFVLKVAPGTIVRFSFVGFQDHTETINDATTLNILLRQTIVDAGDVVVVTAFGRKERKEAVVGSVTSVNPANLKIPASNLTTALAGQMAGIIAYQGSGQPGMDNATFFVRGVTTFGYKKDPLILIDNVEMTSSDLARLQVDDIASFSILKDASATALYGARGANGVILVSTKEGR